MRSDLLRIVLLALPCLVLSVLAGAALTGCNTVQGVGEDVSAAGQGITNASEATEDAISGEND